MGAPAVLRQPTDKPPFTLAEIRKAIPPHCFERSLIKSSYYLLHDLFIVAALVYLATVVIPALPAGLPRLVAWTLYWVAQGCVWLGVWTIGHECGHHAFSDYQLLDDALGLVLHSWLLVPYFSWKYSHRRHHSNRGSLERDENFVPQQKAALACDRERVQVFVTDVSLLAVWFALFKLASAFGFWSVVRVYGMPLLVVNAWLVRIVYLHHTHQAVPHYDSSEWDWLRGALATVDRDYGVLNYFFHHIADTHVLHHLFSAMPHYHAMEATKAIRPLLGDYYKFDATPIAKALWRETRECVYVESMGDGKGVFCRDRLFADNLMRLASTSEGAEAGNSVSDPLLRLEDKKPDEDKEPGDNV
ncbi:hypothetical protein ACQ4PT_047941 [Festuca glaucescens]